MVTKHCKDRRAISLSSKKEKNYECDTGDDIDADQTNDKCLLQLWVTVGKKL